MKSLHSFFTALMLGLSLQWLPTTSAFAGRTCEKTSLTVAQLQDSLELAHKTQQQLEAQFAKKGTEVVILARAGQDLSRYRLRYSHLGIAYRIPAQGSSRASWRVVHKLNECGSAVASLYKHGLAEFFLDGLFAYEAAWVSLEPSLQKQLIAAIQLNKPLMQLHEPNYNMLSYPWSMRYQQSNQWVLELIAYAHDNLGRTADRQSAQSTLQQLNYVPTTLEIGPLTRLGGMSRANIAFDDHPNGRRFANKIDTATVESIFTWLRITGLGVDQSMFRLR